MDQLEIFFSNHLEILYQQLKSALFSPSTSPLMRRIVVVQGPAMKNWLTIRMALDSEINVAMGIEFIYSSQAIDFLLQQTAKESPPHFPSVLELSFAIESELYHLIQNGHFLKDGEKLDWSPLLHYLKLGPDAPSSLSRKTEKRLVGLSEQLARLFHDYGYFAKEMTEQWEKSTTKGWQPYLWRKLFKEKKWGYPCRDLKCELAPGKLSVTFFSISFISSSEFNFLSRLSNTIPVKCYFISPCAVFWSDIRSDRESTFIENYWEKRLRKNSQQLQTLEELLRDRNPLLANFGRLGREMACRIEESQAKTYARYVLPEPVQEFHLDFPIQDDFIFIKNTAPLTLLQALQADLLLMRNPQKGDLLNFEGDDLSIQLHIVPCKRREVEVLYHNILRLIVDNPDLCPSDIIVMAPQIDEYATYIQSIFGAEQSKLDFQLLDLGMRKQNEVLQGFLHLLNICEGRWNTKELLQLFNYSSFQRRHQLIPSDCTTFQGWIEQVGIHWGDDDVHRTQLLKKRHCRSEITENGMMGTWDYGISRLMLGLLLSQTQLFNIPLSPSLAFSEGELLGKWVRLIHALRDDLSPLQDGSFMTISDWANYLLILLETYFSPDLENRQSILEYEELKEQFETLRTSSLCIPEARVTFVSIKARLLALFDTKRKMCHEEHFQAVRFCSLIPLRSMPAKAIALMGMQEEAFPRTTFPLSLDELAHGSIKEYRPSSNDFDRYLFLEILHSAQNYLVISYCGYNQKDSKELNPSLVVEELFSYLDRFFTVGGKKGGMSCMHKHPFDSFDPNYFLPGSKLNNFSEANYRAAKNIVTSNPDSQPVFVQFECLNACLQDFLPSKSYLNLRSLTAAAKDPIKFHFNKAMEIYFEASQERAIRTDEEVMMNDLDYYTLRQKAIKTPIEVVLTEAEKEGKLPLGAFKEVSHRKLKRDLEEIHCCLDEHAIAPSDIFEIEFSSHCMSIPQKEGERWIFPPMTLTLDEGYEVSIIGKIPFASRQGLFYLGKDSLSDVWKMWPQFLLYCCAARMNPGHFQPVLIASKASHGKNAFFDDPIPYLKEYLRYYALCLKNLSPLHPEYIPFILKEDLEGLNAKITAQTSEKEWTYQNPYHQRSFKNHPISSAQSMIDCWKNQTERLVGEIRKHWFPDKLQRTND